MIQYLVMDVDGTLTDGKIYMADNGELCKAFMSEMAMEFMTFFSRTESRRSF